MWWMCLFCRVAFALHPELQSLSQSVEPFLREEASHSKVRWSPDFDQRVDFDGRVRGWTYREGFDWLNHVERADKMVQALFSDRAVETVQQDRLKKILRMLQLLIKEEPEMRRVCARNWYYLQIGIPRALGRILLLLKPDLETHVRHHLTGWLPWMHEQPEWAFSGANLVWIAWIQIYKSVLSHEILSLREASKALSDLLVVREPGGEGFQQDGSLHQHGAYIYNGAYGHYLLSELTRFAVLASKTKVAFPAQSINLLVDTLQDTTLMGRKGRFCPSVLGRELIRGVRSMYALSDSCDAVLHLLPQRVLKEEPCEKIKKRIHYSEETIPEFSLAKHYWNAGYTVIHRPDWSVTVRSTAKQFVGTEAGNGENKLGFWLPFGLSMHYRNGREYDHLLPFWNWAHLPGVTNPEWVPPLQIKNVGWQKVSQTGVFSGGVHMWQYALHAFELERATITEEPPRKIPVEPVSLEAKKSIFGFDAWLVFMGTGIQSEDPKRVVTTLDQTFAKRIDFQNQNYDYPVRKSGQVSFLRAGEVGYLFPKSQMIEFSIEERLPKPLELGPRVYDEGANSKRRVLWLGLDHGVKPKGEAYVWMQTVGLALESLKQLAEDPPIRLIRMDRDVHAAWDPRENIYMMSCFKACRVVYSPELSVSLSARSLLILKQEKQGLKMRISSPDPAIKRLDLEIGFRGKTRKSSFETGQGRWLGVPHLLQDFEVF